MKQSQSNHKDTRRTYHLTKNHDELLEAVYPMFDPVLTRNAVINAAIEIGFQLLLKQYEDKLANVKMATDLIKTLQSLPMKPNVKE